MRPFLVILAAILATPLCAQTPPTDPAEVMRRVMAAFSSIDRTPEEVMAAFLPEELQQDRLHTPLYDVTRYIDDPQAVFFGTFADGRDPLGYDGIALNCIRFGPETLAYAQGEGMQWAIGPMLLLQPNDGWTGATLEDLPELGRPQVFPPGAVLRQDCEISYGLPADMPVKALAAWPAAAVAAIEGQFGTLTTEVIVVPAPNTRLGVRASDPVGDPAIQVRLMLGMMPYRPFDDVTMPVFGLDLRATTYLFAPDS